VLQRRAPCGVDAFERLAAGHVTHRRKVIAMSRSSPLGAFTAGLVAGFVGSLAQNLYFAWTRKLAPQPAREAFAPVEPEQASEMPTQTLARRVVEHVVQRGPLEHKASAAQIVHLSFGSAWGGAYGLVAGSLSPQSALKSGLTFGLIVCLASDDILLPAFKLSGGGHLRCATARCQAGDGRTRRVLADTPGSTAAASERAPRLAARPARRVAGARGRAGTELSHWRYP
jgi:uncharacterized membrane protein YagU involved in acid resistance